MYILTIAYVPFRIHSPMTIVLVAVMLAFYFYYHPWYFVLPFVRKRKSKLKIVTQDYFDEVGRIRQMIDESRSAIDFKTTYAEIMEFKDRYKRDWDLLYRHWCEHFAQRLAELKDKELSSTAPDSKSKSVRCYHTELFTLFDAVTDVMGNNELDILASIALSYNLDIGSKAKH